MAKLSKLEAHSLAYNMVKELNVSILKKNRELEEKALDDFYQTDVGVIIKSFLDDENRKFFINIHAVKSSLKIIRVNSPSVEEIMRKLIIAQIDSTDVQSIVESIKNEYLKKIE